MEYRDNADISGGSVNRAGGGGLGSTGGRLAVGGGGGLIILILALIFGFDPSGLLGGGTGTDQAPPANPVTQCTRGSDVAKNRECRWNAYMASIGSYWSGTLRGFKATSMTTFSGQVSTGCGAASSSVGPFYCPVDQVIYIDTDYTQTLLNQLGARGGDAAEAYIVAHEYGHHIQNLTGVMAKAQSSQQTGAGSPSVRLELQADCYAGVWFRHATDDPNDVIKSNPDDLSRIVDAAVSVGDDAIQKAQTGSVNQESWTHGSSAQRKNWMSIGYSSGDPTKCDTFSATNLG
ncbi:MAG TPA: neutral zinc metallopeptidase [Propionibacteriaceae bacterium]|nr:neutral zinc metallopeptidase [Propionibacteriaceae bacterium]